MATEREVEELAKDMAHVALDTIRAFFHGEAVIVITPMGFEGVGSGFTIGIRRNKRNEELLEV